MERQSEYLINGSRSRRVLWSSEKADLYYTYGTEQEFWDKNMAIKALNYELISGR